MFPHLLFFGPATVFPGEDGKKDGPQVRHSAEKPDSLENKVILQMRNQSPNTTAPIYSTSGCTLGNHGPPQTQEEAGGGKRERLTPLTPTVLCTVTFVGFALLHAASLRERVPCSAENLI